MLRNGILKGPPTTPYVNEKYQTNTLAHKVHVTHGMESSLWVEAYDNFTNFCMIDPSAPLPFPALWVASRHEQRCSGLTDPVQFWAAISRDNLVHHGFLDTTGAQGKLIAARIVASTQMNSLADIQTYLKALMRTTPVGAFDVKLQEQLQAVRRISLGALDSADDRLMAIKLTEDCTLVVASSLMALPRGRLFVEQRKVEFEIEKADSVKNSDMSIEIGNLSKAIADMSSCGADVWFEKCDGVATLIFMVCTFIDRECSLMKSVHNGNTTRLRDICLRWISLCVA